MEKHEPRRKDKLYINIFLSVTTATIIAVIVLSSIIYFNFQNILLYHIFNSEKSSLSQVSYNAKIMTEYATTFALQLFSDKDVSQALYRNSLDSIDTNSLIKKLETYENSTPFIDSIYIYNAGMRKFFIGSLSYTLYPVYDEKDFFDRDIVNLIGKLTEYGDINPIPRTYKLPSYTAAESITSDVYTFVFKGYPVKNSAMVLNVSRKWMEDAIESFDNNAQGETFIIDSKGVAVADRKNSSFLIDLSQNKYIQRIINSNNTAGYFVDNVEDVKSLIIYAKYDWLNWYFIRSIPYEVIMYRIEGMKRSTLIICFSILAASFLIGFVLSKRFYKPVDNLLTRLKRLEEYRINSLHSFKQEFLKNIILNESNYCVYNSIEPRFKEFNISLNIQKPVIILLFMIDRYSEFCNIYNYNDRSLFKFSIMNIASESFSSKYENELVDLGEDKILAILNIDEAKEGDSFDELKQVVTDILTSTQYQLKTSLSVTVSSIGLQFNSIKQLYDEACRLSNYRLFYGYNSIITTQILNENKSRHYSYPVKKSGILIEALKAGKIDEVESVFQDILEEAAQYSYAAFQMVVTRLAFDINTAVDTIEINSGIELECDLGTFITKLNKLETLKDVNEHFLNIFQHIVSRLQDKKDLRHVDVIRKVTQIINERYSDQGLCIDSIADTVNISSAYLGRLFKKSTAKSIPDYINEVRMEKARQFLISTAFSVDTIAERTGFTNSPYFYRVFKKIHGVTPYEYKIKHGRQ